MHLFGPLWLSYRDIFQASFKYIFDDIVIFQGHLSQASSGACFMGIVLNLVIFQWGHSWVPFPPFLELYQPFPFFFFFLEVYQPFPSFLEVYQPFPFFFEVYRGVSTCSFNPSVHLVYLPLVRCIDPSSLSHACPL